MMKKLQLVSALAHLHNWVIVIMNENMEARETVTTEDLLAATHYAMTDTFFSASANFSFQMNLKQETSDLV